MKQQLYRCMFFICLMTVVLGWSGMAKVWAAPNGFIMQIELSPAMCKIDHSQKKMRQCLEGYSLVVSKLIPEGVNPKSCETSSVAVLTPVQKRILMRIMPDENAQARLWRAVGGCVSMNAGQYFRLIVRYAEKLNMPAEVTTPNSIVVNRDRLKQRFIQLNPNMPSTAIQFSCAAAQHKPVLTKIQLCYKTNGNYTPCREVVVNASCPSQFAIQGSY